MKLAARVVTALAVLGLAAPALPCDYMKTTQASAQQPSPTASEKEKVAKAEKSGKAQKAKDTRTQKAPPPTAAN